MVYRHASGLGLDRLAVAGGGLREGDPHLIPDVLAVGRGGRALGHAHDVGCGGEEHDDYACDD